MKIVCLVKQVPHPAAIEFDEETKTLKREGVPLVLNPFDRAAVAEAARLRERVGGEVVAMTMGPPQAASALREAVAVGADRAVHLSDRVFAVADTIGTARTLALALQKEGFDLVLCGRKTIDSETWQVPPEVAAFLGVPHLTNVGAVKAVEGRLRAVRETDTGDDVYAVEPPAVLSIARALTSPVAEAANAPIDLRDAHDLVHDLREDDTRFGQTGSPTRVLAVRDVTPERARMRAASTSEAATAVTSLLAERPAEEVSWEKPPHAAEQPAASYDCWTLVELDGERPTRHALELLARGRALSGKLGGENVALVAGHGVEGAIREAGRYGADVVFDLDDAILAGYEPEAWAAALCDVLRRHRPHVLLISASAFGRDVGPRVAGELELGMTGDCVGVDIARAGRLLQTKPAYGGNIVSVIMGATTPQLATVRAGMYAPLEPRDDAVPAIRHVRLERVVEPRTQLVERRSAEASGLALDGADVVVLAGSGVREADLEELRALDVPLAGTHTLCDAGWLPHRLEVGLYGRPVAPRVLIALGVGDDVEDVAGFVKAGVVVAVGPAGVWADVIVDDDWRSVVPNIFAAVR